VVTEMLSIRSKLIITALVVAPFLIGPGREAALGNKVLAGMFVLVVWIWNRLPPSD